MSYSSETHADSGTFDDLQLPGLAERLRRIERRQIQDEGRRATDHHEPGDPREAWPAWGQLVLAVLAVIVSVVLAYGALNTRITVMESKLDDLKQQIGALHR